MQLNSVEQFLASLEANRKHSYLAKGNTSYQLFLDRLGHLLALLGNPEKKIPHYIHVTGTSGKGSVCRMLASIFSAAKRGPVGLVTSPGVTGLLDRVEVNGVAMSATDLVRFTNKVKEIVPEYKKTASFDLPSPFEAMTAIALFYLAEKKVRTAVVEVGLGGRYDSTNIIPFKDAAIITNIGADHLDIIGPTLADVAREKAGIIKPHAKIFTAEQNKQFQNIFRAECKKTNTTLTVVRLPTNLKLELDLSGTNFVYQKTNYHVKGFGRHQVENALLAINVARKLGIDKNTIRAGLAKATFPIRFEIASQNPLVILDGAHNPDKMATTVAAFKDLKKTAGLTNLHLVLGFSADKDSVALLKLLHPLHPVSVAATRFTLNARPSLEPKKLLELAKKYFPDAVTTTYNDPKNALKAAIKKAKKGPASAILVTGSMFLAGECRVLYNR